MGNALLIAAGGGGDAISAAALGPILGLTDDHPTVMTYAWDRLLTDPLPGPRSAQDFDGLVDLAPNVLQITPNTHPISPAGSTLPRLAAELPARLLLLDPTGGAVGMSEQIAAATKYIGADRLVVIDVGGDAMTNGQDEGLRSPLADLLAIAAASLTELPAQLVVPGPGLDGELVPGTVVDRILRLNGRCIARLGAESMKEFAPIFTWHPSEASGLLTLATRGVRGAVEVRDVGSSIDVSKESSNIYSLDLQAVASGRIPSELRSSISLVESQQICMELTGVSEIDYEVEKARTIGQTNSRLPTWSDLEAVDKLAADAKTRNVGYISIRRLAEMVGIRSPEHLDAFRGILRNERTKRYAPPVYLVGDL